MIALIVIGIGIILIALAVGALATAYSTSVYNTGTFTNFLNGVAAGVAVDGIGAMIYGVGKFLESIHRGP